MPELPEVETVRTGLQEFLSGQTIKSVDCNWPKSLPVSRADKAKYLIGAKIQQVNRRGKLIIIPLNSGYSLLIHLKMTGQLVYRSFDFVHDKPNKGKSFGGGHPTDSLIDKLPDKSTRITIKLTSGTLFFNDQRKFGWIKLEPTKDLEKNNAFLQKLGPEPLEDSYSFDQFKVAIQKRSKTSIKAAILDQTVLAGVGNIYADEALFAARIHPSTKVGQVSTVKLKRLYEAIRGVMKLSISLGGSSDRNYVDAKGNKGSYLKFAKVFRREGQECLSCGGKIVKIRVAGRGTHICPKCQKPPKSKDLIERKINYFSFGSNNWGQLCARVDRKIPKPRPAILRNNKLVFQGSSDNWKGSSSANIKKNRGTSVKGALYELINDDLAKLTEFEPRYITKQVSVEDLRSQKTVRAVVFIVKDREPERKPSAEYLAAWKKNLNEVGFETTA